MEPSKAVSPDTHLPLIGTVVAIQANYYRVQLSDELLLPLCTRRSRLKKMNQTVMVGDRVVIEEPDWVGGGGAISEVLPRSSELDRPPVANAEQILLVFAMAQPALDPYQLSQFLIKAESTGLTVQLGLSKCDLVSESEIVQWDDRLQQWGYEPVFLSVHCDRGIDTLMPLLDQTMTIVSGPSGVGKSSLINRLIPNADLRVAAVSGKLERGRHTTRHVELFELPGGGLLADTPGFNQPDLTCAAWELAGYFPEIRQRLATHPCQFSDCWHLHEPGCGVRGDWERYLLYVEGLEAAIAHQQIQDQQRNAESAVKMKMSRRGQQRYEPKLEAKKYRRTSRRSHQQTLQTLDFSELATEAD